MSLVHASGFWLSGLALVRARSWLFKGADAFRPAAPALDKPGRLPTLFAAQLTVAAGVLRGPFWSFLTLVAIAKTLRRSAAATSGLVA